VNPPPRFGFAAVTWLPTLFRLARLVERSRLDRIACSGSSPVRAFGHATFVDFCHRYDPQARSSDPRYPRSSTGSLRSRVGKQRSAVTLRAPLREQGSTNTVRVECRPGQGPSTGSALSRATKAPSNCDGSQRRLCPNPASLGHFMSRSPRTVRRESPNGYTRCAHEPCNELRGSPPCSGLRPIRSRAASHASSRKETCSAAPEVPSTPRTPFAGVALTFGVVSNGLGLLGKRLFDLRWSPGTDGAMAAVGTRPRPLSRGFHHAKEGGDSHP
jgi:hypothetical protein